MKKTSVFLTSSLLLLTSYFLSASVLDDASFTIQEGWNAVYLPVTPEASADEVFADWPTDKVGFYDQAAFLRTKQFDTSASETTLGAVENGMKIWVRGNPGLSTFSSLTANGIYIFRATNETDMTVTVRGVPEAMRVSWHVSVATNQPLNMVGVSTDGSMAELTEAGYFQGIDTGWTYAEGVIRDPWGFDEDPTLDLFYGGVPAKTNLGVVAMDAAKASDWSGALNVSPMDGVYFGTNRAQRIVSIRNDAGTNRVVGLKLRTSANNLPVPKLLFTCSVFSGVYTNLVVGKDWATELAPGETLKMYLSLDRSTLDPQPEYGAILDVIDISTANPTHFKTSIPISATVGGGETAAGWPAGLWTVNLSLDKVADLKAGATMETRVLVHVGEHGEMNLLQRARVGSRRISSVVLPTDGNTIPDDTNRVTVTDGVVTKGAGAFGENAAFVWTVADRSRVNPFRHAKHPDHDGLDWDFKDTLASGDNFTNYVATVKPELFSVSNRLEFAWDAHAGASWNPTETLSGDCTWYLYGLRHEHDGVIKTSGTFTMKRISKEGLEAVKEEL